MFHNKSKSKSNNNPEYTEDVKTIETCSNLNNKDGKRSRSVIGIPFDELLCANDLQMKIENVQSCWLTSCLGGFVTVGQ